MTYAPALEAEMRRFYASLSEKDRRRNAATAAANWVTGAAPPWPRSAAATPNHQIVGDATLPRWSYRACPSGS